VVVVVFGSIHGPIDPVEIFDVARLPCCDGADTVCLFGESVVARCYRCRYRHSSVVVAVMVATEFVFRVVVVLVQSCADLVDGVGRGGWSSLGTDDVTFVSSCWVAAVAVVVVAVGGVELVRTNRGGL
jgi:hypothetical protein